jgi:hypothetical protein
MENIIAIIEDNKVVNLAVGSDEWADSLEQTTVNVTGQTVDIGFIYQDGQIIDPFDLLEGDELIAAKSEIERDWRDGELKLSDWIIPLTDHPQHAAYLVYREELRTYPEQADFPNGDRPIKP